jgi:Mycobacterium membrane protein
MWIAIGAAVVAFVLIIGGAIRKNNENSGSPDNPGGDSSAVVTYVVDGNSNQADITYQNANGDTSQIADAPLPWEEGFAVSTGSFVYVSAQRGEAPGDITCSIEIDGAVVESNTSSGPFTICTASGTV